jgi:hypothetical protein
MSDDTDHTAGKENSENPSVRSESRKSSLSRRQLLKGGALAAPAILTLKSRPVLGQLLGAGDGTCSFTVWTSGNPSKPVDCGDCPTPGNWKNLTGRITLADWIAAGFIAGDCTRYRGDWTCTSGTPFHFDFGGPFVGPYFKDNALQTMRWVMLEHSNHPGNLAVAALLNASHPTISMDCGLTVSQVLGLWQDFLDGRITAGDFKAFFGAVLGSVAT